GMWAFHHMVTFDAEGFYSMANGQKWLDQWVELGRWGFFLLKFLLGTVAINPYFSTTMMFVFLPLSAVLWGFVFYRWDANEQPGWALLVFSALLLSHPVWAQQFAYRNQMEVMSIALALAPVGLLLFGEYLERRSVPCALAAVAVAVFEFGCYQSFIFVYVEAICILLFLRMRQGERKAAWRDLLLAAGFVVLAFVLCSLVSKAVQAATGVVVRTSYLSEQFMWGNRGIFASVRHILSHIAHVSFGDGVQFGAAFGIEALALLGMLVAMLVRREQHPAYAILVVLGMLVSPFLLEIATAGDVVVRSQFALVLAIAFLGAYELDVLARVVRSRTAGVLPVAVVAVPALAAVIVQAQMQGRLFYSDVAAMDEDREVMGQIFYQAMAQGAHEGDALCLVGTRHNAELDTMVESEVVGYSYLEHSGYYGPDKAIEAMQAYGFNVTIPNKEQMEAAERESSAMEVWPTGGSIRVHDGYYVVRLS
ncbi:MAG: glucosyltransferase domain-containing protein, partial [Olsenella sp.]|nr:glucosyltransferase domain-containing protein [Olsenella sp.]